MERPDGRKIDKARMTAERMLEELDSLQPDHYEALATLIKATAPVSAREVYALADNCNLDVHSMETALRKFFRRVE